MTLKNKTQKSKKPSKPIVKQVKRKEVVEDNSNEEIKNFKKFKSDEHAANKKESNLIKPMKETNESENINTETDGEKPDWKKIKQEKKEIKLKRKQKEGGNEIYEIGTKAKQIWEEVRREDCEVERKIKLCKELYGLIKGKAKHLIYSHDTVRVIETLMGVGGAEYRSFLFLELQDELRNICKNKYSRFFVIKLLRYGTREQKDAIMKSMEGHIVSLMKHKVAGDIVELAYNDYANAKQRSNMMQEFFGPRFRVFKEDVNTLEEALVKHPDAKARILSDISISLLSIIEKGTFTNILIHTLLKEYMSACDEEARKVIIENIKEGLLPIIHTRDGSRVAMMCLWYSSAKERKLIIKSFKGHFVKIALEEHGHMVLLAALDCIDDTVLIKKVIFSELSKEMEKLADSESGRKVLKYLVAPRSKLFFHPHVLQVLAEGDKNQTSKKDRGPKFEELLTGQNNMADPILNLILSNIKFWAQDPIWTLFIGAALKSLSGDALVPIFEAIAEICAKPFIPGEEKHFLETSFMSKMVSFLIKNDKERHKKGKPLFSTHILTIGDPELRGWVLVNRGCFILVNLFETEIPEVVDHIKTVCLPLKKKLEKLEFQGAEVLLKKLNS